MKTSSAPVVIFAYRRPRHLEKVLKGLAAQSEARETQIVLFLDGARGRSDRSDVAAVKKVAEETKGFRDVRICTAEKNKGLARSITEGVGTICREHGEAIVLEDDIVPLPGFLSFMNEALGKYRDNRNVMQISG
jgi:GT2 family glycosyltransferase